MSVIYKHIHQHIQQLARHEIYARTAPIFLAAATGTGWLYLATVLDLFSRKMVGWTMAPSMPAELVCAALRMAIQRKRPAGPPTI